MLISEYFMLLLFVICEQAKNNNNNKKHTNKQQKMVYMNIKKKIIWRRLSDHDKSLRFRQENMQSYYCLFTHLKVLLTLHVRDTKW